jgi:hypothetical protein
MIEKFRFLFYFGQLKDKQTTMGGGPEDKTVLTF